MPTLRKIISKRYFPIAIIVICILCMLWPSHVYAQTPIFFADFEDNIGDNNWTFNGGASDGNWLRGQPNPYNTNGIIMEIGAYNGSFNDLLTGIQFIQDVDAGPTSTRSSSVIIPSGTTTIDLFYYFSYYTNSSSADYLLVDLRDQATDNTILTLINTVGSSAGQNATWTSFSQDISALTGQEVYIYVESADLGNPSKVEAALDNIKISNTSSSGSPCTVIISDDFESGLGNWDDPGSDCRLNNNAGQASNGQFSIRLRDNTNTSRTTSVIMDLSMADTVMVAFSYLPQSMETGEDFWLQMSTDGGGSYTTVEDWISGTDFNNNVRYFEQVKITGPLTSNTRFRFVCDASSNGDRIYLDEIVISSCQEDIVMMDCPTITLADTVICRPDILSIDGSPQADSVISHQWLDLGTGTATGYTLSNTDDQIVTLNTMSATGTISLSYTATTLTCSTSDTLVVQVLSDPICQILTDIDTVCSDTELTLTALSHYLVTPDSGMVIAANSGQGFTQTHEIIGVQDPASTKVIITLPTWDDHFDTILLNGQMIIPEIFETASYNSNGMNCQTPWIPNVNGLPRSILEITSTQVRYYSSLTTNSIVMTEVFPTNWSTTPQPFVEGTNQLQFGIQNTAGPVSGSWYIEVIGNLGYTYLWSTGVTTDQITVSPTTTTTYQLTVTSPTGCQSICDKTIYVGLDILDSIIYTGCSGDGYGIVFNGINYNESNPMDTVVLQTDSGCDSITYIHLTYDPSPVVNAGAAPSTLCSDGLLTLADLNPSIAGGITTGSWTSIGGGTFDNNGDFGGPNPATTYTPSQSEIDAGKIILTLTSDDPPGSCEPDADAVMVPISDIRCSNFPWSGN